MDTTNEPVAYRWRSDLGYIYDIYDYGGGEPLYTHPVKTLTDEEIITVLTNKFVKDQGRYASTNLFYIEFARAILKKAQEADKIESLGTVNIGGVHFRNGKEVK